MDWLFTVYTTTIKVTYNVEAILLIVVMAALIAWAVKHYAKSR